MLHIYCIYSFAALLKTLDSIENHLFAHSPSSGMDLPDETDGKIHSRDVTNESCRACLGRKLVVVESFLVKNRHRCANVAKPEAAV